MVFEGRVAVGYDHGYDTQKFYLGLALDPKYIKGSSKAAWRGSGRTSRRMRTYSEIGGRMREKEKRC